LKALKHSAALERCERFMLHYLPSGRCPSLSPKSAAFVRSDRAGRAQKAICNTAYGIDVAAAASHEDTAERAPRRGFGWPVSGEDLHRLH
jgi:hypothetical protein